MIKLPLVQGTYKKVDTSIGGTSYTLVTHWNERTESYTLDVIQDSTNLVMGIKLFSGVDIFAQYSEIDWGYGYVVNTSSNNEDIDYTGIDEDGFVVIIEEDDLE